MGTLQSLFLSIKSWNILREGMTRFSQDAHIFSNLLEEIMGTCMLELHAIYIHVKVSLLNRTWVFFSKKSSFVEDWDWFEDFQNWKGYWPNLSHTYTCFKFAS